MSQESQSPQVCSLYRTYDRKKPPVTPDSPPPSTTQPSADAFPEPIITDTGMDLYGVLLGGQLVIEDGKINHIADHPEVAPYIQRILERLYILSEDEVLALEIQKQLNEQGVYIAREGAAGRQFSVTVEFPEMIGVTQVVTTTEQEEASGRIFSAKRVTPQGTRLIESRFVQERTAEPTNKCTLVFFRRPDAARNIVAESRFNAERSYHLTTAFIGGQAEREPNTFPQEQRTEDNIAYQRAVAFWKIHAFIAEKESFVREY